METHASPIFNIKHKYISMVESNVMSFIEDFSSKHNVTVIAAVLFGSALYKTEKEIDDIDIFLVLNENSVFRGNHYYSETKRIDYFSGSLSMIKKHLDECIGSTETLPFYVFGEGKVLFGEEHLVEIVATCKQYLEVFPGYMNKDTLLPQLWYKITDAYDDLIRSNDQVEVNLAMTEIISASMQFYCIHKNELIKKRGTNDRGEFHALYVELLKVDNVTIAAKKIIDYLSQETGFVFHGNWEVRYR